MCSLVLLKIFMSDLRNLSFNENTGTNDLAFYNNVLLENSRLMLTAHITLEKTEESFVSMELAHGPLCVTVRREFQKVLL